MSSGPSRPSFYITAANFLTLIGPGFWQLNDVPPSRWKQIKNHFGAADTLAIYASGELPAIGGSGSPGGVDWIRLEGNRREDEPDLNAYHYVIGQPTGDVYPVFGPYRKGARVKHWCDEAALESYFNSIENASGDGP